MSYIESIVSFLYVLWFTEILITECSSSNRGWSLTNEKKKVVEMYDIWQHKSKTFKTRIYVHLARNLQLLSHWLLRYLLTPRNYHCQYYLKIRKLQSKSITAQHTKKWLTFRCKQHTSNNILVTKIHIKRATNKQNSIIWFSDRDQGPNLNLNRIV